MNKRKAEDDISPPEKRPEVSEPGEICDTGTVALEAKEPVTTDPLQKAVEQTIQGVVALAAQKKEKLPNGTTVPVALCNITLRLNVRFFTDAQTRTIMVELRKLVKQLVYMNYNDASVTKIMKATCIRLQQQFERLGGDQLVRNTIQIIQTAVHELGLISSKPVNQAAASKMSVALTIGALAVSVPMVISAYTIIASYSISTTALFTLSCQLILKFGVPLFFHFAADTFKKWFDGKRGAHYQGMGWGFYLAKNAGAMLFVNMLQVLLAQACSANAVVSVRSVRAADYNFEKLGLLEEFRDLSDHFRGMLGLFWDGGLMDFINSVSSKISYAGYRLVVGGTDMLTGMRSPLDLAFARAPNEVPVHVANAWTQVLTDSFTGNMWVQRSRPACEASYGTLKEEIAFVYRGHDGVRTVLDDVGFVEEDAISMIKIMFKAYEELAVVSSLK